MAGKRGWQGGQGVGRVVSGGVDEGWNAGPVAERGCRVVPAPRAYLRLAAALHLSGQLPVETVRMSPSGMSMLVPLSPSASDREEGRRGQGDRERQACAAGGTVLNQPLALRR